MEAREATIEEGPWDAPHTGAGAGGMDAGADPAAAAADGRAVQAAALPEPGTEKFAALCREHDGRPLVYRFVKRLFDVAFSACVIAIGLVPCLVLSVMIVADTKGSPIYSQIRAGKYGRPFKVWKFRSMVADSDDVEKYLSAEQMRQWKTERKVDDDPRITRLGSVIRRFSLAPVIIGTPGDGEPTKSLSHPENSSLDLQKCERRPGTSLGARHHYTSLQFLSFAVFGGLGAAWGRRRCARGVASLRGLRAVA